MSNHPINLVVAFLLELAGLAAIGIWGFAIGSGWMAVVLAILLPVLAASIWGIFRVPSDPGRALVPIPGILRLLLELSYFGFAVWTLFDDGLFGTGTVLAIFTAGHYIASYDRVWRLIRGNPRPIQPEPEIDPDEKRMD